MHQENRPPAWILFFAFAAIPGAGAAMLLLAAFILGGLGIFIAPAIGAVAWGVHQTLPPLRAGIWLRPPPFKDTG